MEEEQERGVERGGSWEVEGLGRGGVGWGKGGKEKGKGGEGVGVQIREVHFVRRVSLIQ